METDVNGEPTGVGHGDSAEDPRTPEAPDAHRGDDDMGIPEADRDAMDQSEGRAEHEDEPDEKRQRLAMQFAGALHNVGDAHSMSKDRDFDDQLSPDQVFNEYKFTEAMEWDGEWNEQDGNQDVLPGVDQKHVRAATLKELRKFKDMKVFKMVPISEMYQDPEHIHVSTRWAVVSKGTVRSPMFVHV